MEKRPAAADQMKNDLSHNSPIWGDMMSIFGRLNLAHSLCVSAVRVLRRAGELEEPNEELNGIADYFTNLFLKTPGLSNALKLMHAPAGSPPIQKNIAQTHQPYEWAHIFAAYFLSKKLTSLCASPQLRPSFESAFESADVAYNLWLYIPAIPLSDWILAGAIRPLSLLIFSMLDEKAFVAHRRSLRATGRALYSIEKERELFSIDHSVFCSYLCQQLGFGTTRGEDFKKAIDLRYGNDTLSNGAMRLRVAMFWITSIMESLKAPEMHISARYYPSEEDFKKIIQHVTLLRTEGAIGNWLDPLSQFDPNKQKETEVLEAEIPEDALKHMVKDPEEDLDI
jgi:hypothetical protein